MLRQQLAPAAIDIAGVVEGAVRQLRDGAAHDVDAELRRQRGEGGLRGAVLRLAAGVEAVVLIGTAEDLRQNGKVRPLGGGLPDLLAGCFDIFGFFCRYRHLDECDTHETTSYIYSRSTSSVAPPSGEKTSRFTWGWRLYSAWMKSRRAVPP